MRQIFAIIALFAALVASAQRVDYDGGYFERSGNTWNEYKPSQKSGIWNYFNQYSEDKNYWYGDNGNCKIAIPKNPSVNNFHIKFPGKKWEYKYTAKKKSGTGGKKKPEKTRVQCPMCKGGGVETCLFCNGTGRLMRMVSTGYGVYPVYDPCIRCGGLGKTTCMACGGRGYNEFGGGGVVPTPMPTPTPSPSPTPTPSPGRGSDVCTVCGGTGVADLSDGVTPDGIPASRIKYTNHAGNTCPYCGSHRYHCHFKCGGCNGRGR